MILNDSVFNAMHVIHERGFMKALTNYDPSPLEKFVYNHTATNESVSFEWMQNNLTVRKWVGERKVDDFVAFSHTMTHEPYEMSAELELYKLADDNYAGLMEQINQMPNELSFWRQERLTELLENGTTNLCYDGTAFFGTAHQDANETAQSNIGAGALTEANYRSAVLQGLGLTDHRGRVLKIMYDTIVVPTSLMFTAQDLFKTADKVNGSGEENKSFNALNVIVDPFLTNQTAWYLFDTSKLAQPLIVSTRQAPQFKSVGNGSEHAFKHNKIMYGVDTRVGFDYGMWQTAYRSTGL